MFNIVIDKMKKNRYKSFMAIIMVSAIFANSVSVAAGKTIGVYKNTNYSTSKGSDAKTIYNGVKNYDSAYTGESLEKGSVTKAKFYDKTKTIKYWSGHGMSDGTLFGDNSVSVDIFNDKASFSWAGGNLEFVFLAACNQLNKENKNPVKEYATAMRGNKAVRVICGYHSYAPAAGDNLVAQNFIKYAKTGESVKSSWIKANEYVNTTLGYTNAANYAVLTHDSNVQYSRFPGFSGNTYTRPGSSSKKIIRFRRGVTSGETILKSLSLNKRKRGLSVIKGGDNISEIPTYSLKKEDVKFKVDSSCKDIVFNDGNMMSLSGGEIGSSKSIMSKQEIYEQCAEYITENIQNNDSLELNEENAEIVPILMDNALLEGEDVVVGYSVSYSHNYDGYEVEDDSCVAIVDNSGVKFTALNWSKLIKKKVSAKFENIDYSEAVDIVYGDNSLLKGGVKKVKKSQSSLVEKTVDVTIKFVYDKKEKSYMPNYCFVLSNGEEKLVPCYQRK